MKSIAKTLYNLTLNKLHLYRHLVNKMRFKGLSIEPSALMHVEGDIHYGRHSLINLGANIIVPEGSKLVLGNNNYIGRYVEIGPTHCIKIGDYTSLQDRCILVGDIEVGRYCLFSLNVLIASGKHCFDRKPHYLIRDQDELFLSEQYQQNKLSKKVIIEDDCWIGVNVVIMPGVRIGKGSIIGANSVVTKDIPPYSVAVGAPACVVKQRLEFMPPQELCYSRELDYPYFYSGFEISAHERQNALPFEGFFTKQEFELALNTQGYSKIALMVKSTDSDCSLSYNGESKVVGSQFSKIVFDLSQSKSNLLNFNNNSENRNAKLVLQKAWVE
ncbi:MAG: acyltransferase [Proteobacteria bacterium]|nr:acyltransferase [Pseudomonadota bacterium]